MHDNLPSTINLQAIAELWEVRYLKTTAKSIRLTISPGQQHTISLFGAIDNIEKTHALLLRWLKKKSAHHLVPWLQEFSETHKLPFNKVTVRSQRTIWGSCTHLKNISLNYKLIFLPTAYAKNVILHELCHTKHLNHSKRFWALLDKLDPNTSTYNKAIRKAEHFVPKWLDIREVISS